MNNNLVVSIVIVTYNRINRVLDIFEDLKLQSFKKFEVIIVSDGCKSAFGERLKKYSKIFSMQNIDTNLKNKYGLATARNIGLKASKCEYCILIDDDCRLDKNFVQNHYLNREHLTIVGGQRKGINEEKIIMDNKMQELRKLPYQKSIQISYIKLNYKNVSLIENNISFFKDEIINLGSFFEFIRIYGIIGQEFFNRISQNNFKYKYIDEAIITHLSDAKEVSTNQKDKKILKSIISKIFILPIIKNKLFSFFYIKIFSKIDYTNKAHTLVRFLIWFFIIIFSPILLIIKIIKKINL